MDLAEVRTHFIAIQTCFLTYAGKNNGKGSAFTIHIIFLLHSISRVALEKAKDHGYLDVDPPFVEYDYSKYRPKEQVTSTT